MESLNFTKFSTVSFQLDKTNTVWVARKESCRTEDLKSPDRTSYLMDNLHADTYYKVEVRAHNDIGFSVPSELVFKTAMGKYGQGSKIKLHLSKTNGRLGNESNSIGSTDFQLIYLAENFLSSVFTC